MSSMGTRRNAATNLNFRHILQGPTIRAPSSSSGLDDVGREAVLRDGISWVNCAECLQIPYFYSVRRLATSR